MHWTRVRPVTAAVCAALLAVVATPRALEAQILGATRTPGQSCVYYQPPSSTLNQLSVDQAIQTVQTTLWQMWFGGAAAQRVEVNAAQIIGYFGRDQALAQTFREIDPRIHRAQTIVENESFWSGQMVEKTEASYVLKIVSGPDAGKSAFVIPENKAGGKAADMRRVADAVYVLNAQGRMQWSPEYQQRFDQAVDTYNRLSVKPALPEDARRYRVQAEAMLKDSDFQKAAEYFERGLELAPWWPEGHFNLALVYEGKEDYPAAIIEMKRYLALAPRATDAREMQDKIYEWELRASKQADRVDPGCGDTRTSLPR